MMKQTLTAAALAVVLATPAFAQTAKPDATGNPVTQSTAPSMTSDQVAFVQNQRATDWRGSKLIGATVYGPDNASIGDINDVLIANDGKVNAVVIGVGGFLGVGEKNVAIPFEKLSVTRKPESAAIAKIAVSYSKAELTGAPKFAYYDPAASTTTGSSTTDKIKALNPMGDKSDKMKK